MNDESFHYAYIVFKENPPDENTKVKLSSLIKNLKGTIYFPKTVCESYGTLAFQNPMTKSNILPQLLSYQINEDQFFPIMSPMLDEETLLSTVYITNLPDGSKNADLASILSIFDTNASVGEIIPKMLTYIDPTKKNFLLVFLPHMKFKNETKINVTIDRFQIPVISVSNLPNNFRKKEFSLFKCPHNYINCEFKVEEQEQLSKTAYLSFPTVEKANEAIEYFNFAQIDSNEISAIHFIPKGYKILRDWEISVKRISPESKGFDIWSRFKNYGPILCVEIKKNHDSGSVYGIVQFYKKESAEAAIKAIEQQQTTIIADFTVNFVVSIYNIETSVTQQDIAQYFKHVSKVEIIQPQRGNLASAQVTFHTTQAASSCLKSQQVHNGVRWIMRKGFQNKSQKDEVNKVLNDFLKSNTIIIKNLPKGFQPKTLIEMCSPFGLMRYLFIRSDTATVSFEEEKSAKDACEGLLAQGINNNSVTVELY